MDFYYYVFIDAIIIVFLDSEGNCSPIKSFDHSVTTILTRNDAENSREYLQRLMFVEIRRTLILVGTADNKYSKKLDSTITFSLKLPHHH